MFKNCQNCKKQCTTCKLFKVPHKLLSQSVDHLVGISSNILERVKKEKYFSNVKTSVIYNLRTIENNKLTTHNVREIFTIGYIGSLIPSKGVEWLIEEFKRIKLPIKLIIAGNGEANYVSRLKEKAKGFDIVFLGFCNSHDFYSTIDLNIVPSLWEEPLGMVAVESCAYNVPVLANKKGGLKEIIIDGVNGLFCDEEDAESLGNGISYHLK